MFANHSSNFTEVEIAGIFLGFMHRLIFQIIFFVFFFSKQANENSKFAELK